jgi:hypothetical protein
LCGWGGAYLGAMYIGVGTLVVILLVVILVLLLSRRDRAI